MRVPAVLLGAFVALVLAPTLAAASTYCAGTSGGDCSATYPATGAGLQQALDAADLGVDIGGTPDTVRIGPGTYGAANGFRTLGGDLSIVGAGESTILTSTGPPTPETAVVLALKGGGTAAASVRSIQVLLTSPVQAGGIFMFREVADVHIGGPGTLVDDAIQLPDGGRVTRTRIDPAAFKSGIGIDAASGVIEDTFMRVHVAAPADRANGVIGYGDATIPSRVLTLRHVTLLGDGSPSTVGVRATTEPSNATVVSESIQVRDSVVRGFGFDLSRQGHAGDPSPGCKSLCKDAVAAIESRYSSLASAPAEESGAGALTAGPGVLSDPEPGLAADGTIQAGSPLINAGDPAGPEAGDSATDLAGNERIQVGRRDIGALESPFAPVVPPVPITPGGSVPVHRAPVISALTLSHRRFRVGAPPRRGTRISLRLSAPAALSLRVDRVLAGRRLVRRGKPAVCRLSRRVKAHKAASRGKPCRIYRKVGTLRRAQAGGAISIAFSGRFGRTALPAGAYRLTVDARDGTGAAATPKRITFTIVR